jgi:sialic acid synthase SpsE
MTFIIAECGVNWRDLVDADQMIKEAAEAGANAAKFQAFNQTQFTVGSFLYEHALKKEDIYYLYWRCQQHGIEFMCTPMYLDAVQMLDPYIKRWKLRFMDRNNVPLILMCAKTRKDILISGGNKGESKHMIPFYCCPEYPPAHEPKIFAWGNTPAMLQEAGYKGYSCHIPNWKHAAFAVEHNGLDYLEIHVRLDEYEPHYCPVDAHVSITMSDLAMLCQRLKK